MLELVKFTDKFLKFRLVWEEELISPRVFISIFLSYYCGKGFFLWTNALPGYDFMIFE